MIVSAITAYAGDQAQNDEVVGMILMVFFLVTTGSAMLWAYGGSWISQYLKKARASDGLTDSLQPLSSQRPCRR